MVKEQNTHKIIINYNLYLLLGSLKEELLPPASTACEIIEDILCIQKTSCFESSLPQAKMILFHPQVGRQCCESTKRPLCCIIVGSTFDSLQATKLHCIEWLQLLINIIQRYCVKLHFLFLLCLWRISGNCLSLTTALCNNIKDGWAKKVMGPGLRLAYTCWLIHPLVYQL